MVVSILCEDPATVRVWAQEVRLGSSIANLTSSPTNLLGEPLARAQALEAAKRVVHHRPEHEVTRGLFALAGELRRATEKRRRRTGWAVSWTHYPFDFWVAFGRL